MAGNALPILLLGGAAALVMVSGKKKKSKFKALGLPEIPKLPGTGQVNPTAPEWGSPVYEEQFVNTVLDGKPKSYWLGDKGQQYKVDGMDAQGFANPLPNETAANWYTRVAYYGAYPYGPYVIPPQCMAPELAKKLGVTCDPGFFPWRDALMRIYATTVSEMKKRGMTPSGRIT